MGTRDFSGADVYSVLVNVGSFRHVGTTGSHAILEWTAPPDHDTDHRHVTIPLHDRIDLGTLRSIADQAGAEDFEEFPAWIDRNRRSERGDCGGTVPLADAGSRSSVARGACGRVPRARGLSRPASW